MKKIIKPILIILTCILCIGLISSLFSGSGGSTGTSTVPSNKPNTQAPIEETTEDPKVVELRELVDDIPIFFELEDLTQVNAPGYSVYPSEGIVFNNVSGEDAHIWFFANRGADLGYTGQYLFMKYRTSASDKLYMQIYTSTDHMQPSGCCELKLIDDSYITRDGEWHVLAIDLSALIQHCSASDDGNYYLKHLLIDVEGFAGAALEISYLGITDDLNDVVRYVELTEPNPSDLLGNLVEVAE